MIWLYLLTLLCLGVYSYSQIDLNLTLLQAPWFLSFQQTMIQLGYYHRPLATGIFLTLIFLLFIFYWQLLKNPPRKLYFLIGGIVLVGLLSYPAFSYDFFNYLFDIRILTHYGQNPYLFKPLDFPLDSWLRFMHWVHRPYPYGPLWLVITFFPSLAGLGKFVLTALNFKALFVALYLGNIFLIRKILLKVSSEQVQKGIIFFAFNPLVIIEAVVSPHLDSVMTFFLLLGIYYLVTASRLLAIMALLVSAGIKFLTLLLLPIFLFRPASFAKTIKLLLLIFLLSLIPVIWRREFYPWYFLPVVGLLALLPLSRNLFWLSLAAGLGLTIQYAPYLYVGSYPPDVQLAKNVLLFLPIIITALTIYGSKIIKSN